jgi:2-amino-4-hydroxy-6-hydroxymethyldihydropteridine diphosphokinase
MFFYLYSGLFINLPDKSRFLEIIIQNLIVNLIKQIKESMSIAYLLSGSNQGDRSRNLINAISYINKLAGELIECSPLFESPAWGFDHPTPFLNQALKLKTSLDPEALLQTLLLIEIKCGRVRNNNGQYAARTLDIDILFYDDSIIETEGLEIPHPRVHLRRFALIPLSAIAPQLIHPGLGKSVQDLLLECPDKSIVRKFTDNNCQKKEVRDAV